MTRTAMKKTSAQPVIRHDPLAASFTHKAVHCYRLIYAADRTGTNHVVEFDAPDAQQALNFGRLQPAGRKGELWRDGERLCQLTRAGTDSGYWIIEP